MLVMIVVVVVVVVAAEVVMAVSVVVVMVIMVVLSVNVAEYSPTRRPPLPSWGCVLCWGEISLSGGGGGWKPNAGVVPLFFGGGGGPLPLSTGLPCFQCDAWASPMSRTCLGAVHGSNPLVLSPKHCVSRKGGGLFEFQTPPPGPPKFSNPSFSNLRIWGKGSAPMAPKFFFSAFPEGVFFSPCVYTQNTQNFVENSKMFEKHRKVFDP